MREILATLNFHIINETVRINSAPADNQEKELAALADAIAATIPKAAKRQRLKRKRLLVRFKGMRFLKSAMGFSCFPQKTAPAATAAAL